MKSTLSILAIALLVGVGCTEISPTTAAPASAPEFSNTFTSATGFVARAVVAGLTAVDPSAWGG